MKMEIKIRPIKQVFLTNLVLIIFAIQNFAQVPESFKYQAVVRDETGIAITNTEVNIEINILRGSTSGTSIFSETHTTNTNAFGLVNLEIGSINTSDFSAIDWANGPYYVQITVDGSELGTSQLLSVPYALHAQTAENVTNLSITGEEETFALWDQNKYDDFTGDYNDLLHKPDFITSPNILIGEEAGKNSGEGQYILAIGDSALYKNGIGADEDNEAVLNSAIGFHSLYNNTTGSRNTAFGPVALSQNKTGNFNIAIGVMALANNDKGDYNTAIGNGSIYSNITGSSNTAIGTYALYSNTIGSLNTAIGISSLNSNTSGTENTAIGNQSLELNDSGNFNTAVGSFTLKSITSGNSNVALGIAALCRNRTRSNLVAIGDSALYNNETDVVGSSQATGNTAIGSKSLFANTTGYSNTALGFESLIANTEGTSNIASGYWTLYHNTIGSHNTAVGYQALYYNETGDYNTGIGDRALRYNYYGNYNTAIGYSAGVSAGSPELSITTAIGYLARVSSNNTIRLGNSTIHEIGGYAPWTELSDGRFKVNVKSNVPGLEFIMKLNPVTFNWDLHKLDNFLGVTESVYTENPELETARAEKESKLVTGFIAQEVEKAAEDCNYNFSGIIKPANEKSHYSLSYSEFVVPLVKALQEQQEIIEQLKKRISELEKNLITK